jgi:S-adenosylmethionine-diacylglycerol 3-amino-3-carboxypropyl transferase
MVKRLQTNFFALIHGNRLIYNTCWEDPRIDRQLLHLGPNSSMVAITSAGCNVLDYLLDGPGEIHAVDVNFRQNALLWLKMSLFQGGDQGALFSLFGQGGSPDYRDIYAAIRWGLPDWAQKFWDQKMTYFSPQGLRKSFYWRSAAGDFAWFFQSLLLDGKKKGQFQALLEAESLEEQALHYSRIEPRLFRREIAWLIQQPPALAFIGVPTPQLRLIESNYRGGFTKYLRDKLRKVFTTLPIRENYFWRVYLTGSYTPDCCPGYLRAANFQALKDGCHRVRVHNATVTEFLRKNPGPYTHFVLLDHLDWLAWHETEALLEEWRQIFQNSRPGTKILMRSAGPDLSFLPTCVRDRLRFFPELTQSLHEQDRVGTYGSLHLGEVL